MDLETSYRTALELTHQMLACARAQEWEQLVLLGEQRAVLVEQTAGRHPMPTQADGKRIAAIIGEIQQESAEIIERVETWQKHVRILLRMDKAPAS